jgi:hypothetical protein
MRPGAAWLALLLLAPLLPALPGAGGQPGESLGLSPPFVDVPGAQPAQSYVRTVQLQNEFDSQSTITAERNGTAGAWTTLTPASGFTMAARTVRQVTLTIAVPGNQGPGSFHGEIRFLTEPKQPPSGSGLATRFGATLLLNVTVGGARVERITWSAPRVEDAAQGADVHAFASARNEGNVRTTAVLRGDVLPFTGDNVLQNATGRLAINPGEVAEVQVTFKAGLEPGQYRARLRADGLDETLPFKVVQPGFVPPDGTLRAILHAARVPARQAVRIDAWFQNTGGQAIRSAQFKAEVRKDGDLLAPLQSDALAVAPGQSVNLTVYWTPPAAGTYTISGHVVYDSFFTPDSQSLLNVDPAPGVFPWWWLLVALAVVLLVAWLWAWLRRRRRERRARSHGGRGGAGRFGAPPASTSRRFRRFLR